jgi:hypothetical protein
MARAGDSIEANSRLCGGVLFALTEVVRECNGTRVGLIGGGV